MADNVRATDGPPREVRKYGETATGPAYGSVSRGRYDAPIEDVWSLFADPERMRLWNPDTIAGDFEPGGEFSVKNNASGRILRCEPPTMFRVSWEWAGTYSEVEVRLGSIDAGTTVVEIEHLMRVDDFNGVAMTLSQGLVAAGNGWDTTIDYLGRYLRGELDEPPTAHGDWAPSEEDERLSSRSETLWRQVAKEALDEPQ
jgi:uncharacterized protein YndB with AHSA1/START domain